MKIRKVVDSFFLNKGNILVLTFDAIADLKPKIGQTVTLFNAKDIFITTTITGVEKFARAIEYPNDSFGISVAGYFSDDLTRHEWYCIFWS